MKKILQSALAITSCLVAGCNGGGGTSSGNQGTSEGTESLDLSFRKSSINLPSSTKKIANNGHSYIDTQSTGINSNLYNLYITESHGAYLTIPITAEVKNDLLLDKEKIDYDVDMGYGSRSVIIFGNKDQLNNRKLNVYTNDGTNRVNWINTYSFQPNNLIANPVFSDGNLYSATATNNVVSITPNGTATELVANDCDGSQTVLLKRVNTFEDMQNIHSNLLVGTSNGSVCLYNTKSHNLQKLVSGNGEAVYKLVGNMQGTMFAYITRDGVLHINKMNGENVSTYDATKFDYAYQAKDILFLPNSDLLITKPYNIAGDKFFATSKWKYKTKTITKAKYHTYSGEVYSHIPTSVDSILQPKGFWDDVVAAVAVVADTVAVVATVAATIAQPELAPETVPLVTDEVTEWSETLGEFVTVLDAD